MLIRPYTTSDKNKLISLLKLNIPTYFDKSEVLDFKEYLERYLESYFVIEDHGIILGWGGINYFIDKGEARLSWDMVHPEFQGKGIGKKLTQYRIELLKNNPQINIIYVRTTQLVFPFYEKSGFALEKTEKDYWAKGFHLYQMKMEIKRFEG